MGRRLSGLERGGTVEPGAGGCVLAGGEKALQDENGGDLIDEVAMILAGFTHGVEMAVGLAGGQALIGEVDWEAKGGADFLGEGLGLQGLRADLPGHMEGIAHDDFRDLVLAEDAADGFEIGVEGAAMKGEEGLDGEAEWIGDGEPDAFAADIEGEDARGMGEGSIGMDRRDHSSSLALGSAAAEVRSL